eukprot:12112663-Alexandrium_andersonii.AAC.1
MLDESGRRVGCLKRSRVRAMSPATGTRHYAEHRRRLEGILRTAGDAGPCCRSRLRAHGAGEGRL